MARLELLNNQQRRLLRIASRMPLASVANLAPVLGMDEEKVRRMLGALRRGGWVTSVVRGMTERRQHRWFLTRRAVELLYVTDHQHPGPRERARAARLAEFHPEGQLPEDYRERFPWTTTIPPTWKVRPVPPSPTVNRRMETATAPTTSTRPGPPHRGASRPPCAAWPCWSRSTPWPRTCCAAGGWSGHPMTWRNPGKGG